MFQVSPYYTLNDFMCKCGCNQVHIQTKLLAKLDALTALLGYKPTINSAYRCEPHNKEVGGKPNSAHLKGYAVDLGTKNSTEKYHLIKNALKVGFNRIGIARTFIHIDCDPSKPSNVIWIY